MDRRLLPRQLRLVVRLQEFIFRWRCLIFRPNGLVLRARLRVPCAPILLNDTSVRRDSLVRRRLRRRKAAHRNVWISISRHVMNVVAMRLLDVGLVAERIHGFTQDRREKKHADDERRPFENALSTICGAMVRIRLGISTCIVHRTW